MYRNCFKRCFDILFALTLLILLAPILALLGIVIRLRMGSPVFFRQERPGRCGKTFRMFKFRTMTDARDKSGNLLSDADRLTPLGRFLRKTSLDELPEFINVLTGEMSVVGPRPLLIRYLPLYSPEQARRHDVRPGVTGWAQVRGRNALSWEDKFRFDVWYVDHLSPGLDLFILILTVWKVFVRDGISAQDSATMPEFTGSPKRSETEDLHDKSDSRKETTE